MISARTIRPAIARGFRGIETVTYVLEGSVEHQDSLVTFDTGDEVAVQAGTFIRKAR